MRDTVKFTGQGRDGLQCIQPACWDCVLEWTCLSTHIGWVVLLGFQSNPSLLLSTSWPGCLCHPESVTTCLHDYAIETEGVPDLGVCWEVSCHQIVFSSASSSPLSSRRNSRELAPQGSDHVHHRGPGTSQAQMASCGWGEGRGTEQGARIGGGKVW